MHIYGVHGAFHIFEYRSRRKSVRTQLKVWVIAVQLCLIIIHSPLNDEIADNEIVTVCLASKEEKEPMSDG